MIVLSATGVTFTEEQIQGGVTITQSVNAGDNIMLGSCVVGKLEFSVLELLDTAVKHYAGAEFRASSYELTPYTFANQELLLFQNGERYYFPSDLVDMGLYTAQKPERIDETKWKFTCLDRMVRFDKLVDEWCAGIHFPIDLLGLLTSLCAYCTVPLATQQFTNSNFIVQGNFEGTDIKGRDVLGWIAELAGCFAIINQQGELILDFYRQTDTVVTTCISNRIADYQVQRIDKLQVRAKENDIGVIVGTGTNAYIIQGNPLLFTNTDAEIRPAAEAIFSKIKELTYTPLELEAYAKHAPVAPGDVVKVVTARGEYTTCVTSITTNGLKRSIVGAGAENRQTLRPVNRSIQQLRGKTNEIIADIEQFSVKLTEVDDKTGQNTAQLLMQAGEISLKVSQTDYNGNTISSLINQTATAIKIQASKINLIGYVTISNLSDGTTTISGSNIKTGTISADRLESSVLTTDNITAKNLTLTGKFMSTTSGGTVWIENGRMVVGSGNNGYNAGAIYWDSGNVMRIRAGVGYSASANIVMEANQNISIKPGSGYPVYIGTGGNSDTVYIGSSSSNLSTLSAYRYYAQGKQGYTGEITYMKSSTSSGKIAVTGGIITKVT